MSTNTVKLSSEELDKIQNIDPKTHNPSFLGNVKNQASITKIKKSVLEYLQKNCFRKTKSGELIEIEVRSIKEFKNLKELYDKDGKTITKDKKIEIINNLKEKKDSKEIALRHLQKNYFRKTKDGEFIEVRSTEEFIKSEELYDKDGNVITKDKKIEIINLLESKTDSKKTALRILGLVVAFIALLILAGSITAICVFSLPILVKALILGGGIVVALVIWGITGQLSQLRVKKNKFMDNEIQALKESVQK